MQASYDIQAFSKSRSKKVLASFLRFNESSSYAHLGIADFFENEIDILNSFGISRNIAPELADILLLESGVLHDSSSLRIIRKSSIKGVLLLLKFTSSTIKKTSALEKLEATEFHVIEEIDSLVFLTSVKTKARILVSDLILRDIEVQKKLQGSKRRLSPIPLKTAVEFLNIPAAELLTPVRFDIAIKCLYGRLWQAKMAKSWRDEVYYEHLLRITGPSKGINEYDGTGKTGFEQYKSVFKSLLSEINPEELPIVPVDIHNSAFDGAHRISAGIVMNRLVGAARLSFTTSNHPTASFFLGTSHGHSPCPSKIIDEAAIEYCRIKGGLVIALIFPTVVSEKFALCSLAQIGHIVYQKEIQLDRAAGEVLLRQAYLGHAWADIGSHSPGFQHKVQACFPTTGKLRVVLLDNCAFPKLRSCKAAIREHYQLGNHSIHFTDGDEEAYRLARTLFNNQSLNVLRMSTAALPEFHQLLSTYRAWLSINDLDENNFCVSGSAVLALMGLRECQDIDFLFHGEPQTLPATPHKIDCHNHLAKYYPHEIDKIIGDPQFHCWYMGVKFCTPRIIYDMKSKRNEVKDVSDCLLIGEMLKRDAEPNSRGRIKGVWNLMLALKISFRTFIHKLKIKIRHFPVRLIKK